MELCINIVWLKHSKSILCAILLKCFYGYIILFLDFELIPLEFSVDSFLQYEVYSSSTNVQNYLECLVQVLVVFTLTNHKEEKLNSLGEAVTLHYSNSFISGDLQARD